MPDSLQAFILNEGEYKGLFVHLDACYQQILALHAYPKPVAHLLGEALAAVTLLSHNVKRAGKLALQIETPGSIKALIVEATHTHGIRGLVQWRDDCLLHDPSLESGKFAITMMPKNSAYYQGIVPIVQQNIAQSLETYFSQSEQIFTRIVLACTDKKVSGLLIQKLPEEKEPTLDSTTLNFLIQTLQAKELLEDSPKQLLHKVFHEYTVRLFTPEKVRFECTCTHDKMVNAVKMLGKEDALALIRSHKQVEVTCEFCNHHYGFDKKEIEQIFG